MQGSRSREMEEETRRKCVRGHDIGDVPFPLKRGVHSRGDICVRMAGATRDGDSAQVKAEADTHQAYSSVANASITVQEVSMSWVR